MTVLLMTDAGIFLCGLALGFIGRARYRRFSVFTDDEVIVVQCALENDAEAWHVAEIRARCRKLAHEAEREVARRPRLVREIEEAS